jgi:hypothetical protein
MSQFIGAALPQMRLERNDDRLQSPSWVTVTIQRHLDRGYRSEWWPRGQSFIGDAVVDVGVQTVVAWGEYDPVGGESSRVGFVGVTRDQYGTPLGGCVVQLFRTSDDLFIMETTSDSAGNFLLQSWYTPDTHYIVAYKAGAPDVFGTTLNTLVGV